MNDRQRLKVGDRVVNLDGEPGAPNGAPQGLPPCGSLPRGARGTVVEVMTEHEAEHGAGAGIPDKFVRVEFDNHEDFSCDKDGLALVSSLSAAEQARLDEAYAEELEEIEQ